MRLGRSAAIAASTVAFIAALTACGGGEGGGSLQVPAPAPTNSLTVDDVQKIIAQGVAEAQARNARATIGVIDRVGNVLAIFKMNGAASTFRIDGAKGATGGLEGLSILPPEFAVIPKAFTAAYFSSAGNAFSTRTAAQVIQESFNPGEFDQAHGPLFGVQFSQLTCSDVSRKQSDGTIGPKRSPLGFAADPGGLPLYKNGTIVGAVGVLADGLYSIDRNILDIDQDVDELIAVAAERGFEPPTDIRADRITADGRTLRFTDSEAILTNPASAPPFPSINGSVGALVELVGYGGGTIQPGTVYGTPASGVRPDTNPAFAGLNAWAVVDAANSNRFPPRNGTDGLMTAAEVQQIMKSALEVANRTRAQVRRPVGSTAQVTIAVVDTNGEIVGLTRQPDALVDAIDAVPQKARTALFFRARNAAAELLARTPAMFSTSGTPTTFTQYVQASRTFFNDPTIFANGIAFSSRSVGNIAGPFFPEGIQGGSRPVRSARCFRSGASSTTGSSSTCWWTSSSRRCSRRPILCARAELHRHRPDPQWHHAVRRRLSDLPWQPARGRAGCVGRRHRSERSHRLSRIGERGKDPEHRHRQCASGAPGRPARATRGGDTIALRQLSDCAVRG